MLTNEDRDDIAIEAMSRFLMGLGSLECPKELARACFALADEMIEKSQKVKYVEVNDGRQAG